MVFTVLSGSSDNVESESFIRAGKKAFIGILASGRLLAQDSQLTISQTQIKNNMPDNGGIREFLAANTEDSGFNNMQALTFPLSIFACYAISIILKNNIWKNAVF